MYNVTKSRILSIKLVFHYSIIPCLAGRQALFQKVFITFVMLFGLVFSSCNKEEPSKIETFSTEAFAYDLGNTWEVNATTRVKGFSQKEEEKKFSATIAYDIDLITPAGDTIKALISRVEDKTESERISDIPLEAQFELDSTYTAGEYEVVFKVKDVQTNNLAKAAANFSIKK